MEGNKMRKRRNWLPLLAVLVMAVLAMTTGAFAAGEEAAVQNMQITPRKLIREI